MHCQGQTWGWEYIARHQHRVDSAFNLLDRLQADSKTQCATTRIWNITQDNNVALRVINFTNHALIRPDASNPRL